jgi:DNA-binding response OmpR family regulator
MSKDGILVINNRDEANDSFCCELENAGFSVISAPNFEQGLKCAIAAQPEIVIMDTDRPMSEGVDACRTIAKDGRIKTSVIVISDRNDLNTKLSCFMAGAKMYITKPFHTPDFLAKVRNTIRQKKTTQAQPRNTGQKQEI